ncbi:hypothetical protein C2G38_2182827 [Gigaspora rosea]|uniref:Uncharacterized protein n=1 Tax=Gigaspora rosea TaxID=44941 RepID=A0A397V9G4_9GLOM|nr:hypothetical protein C2G38_2182827 [Gigaspora rosea]
MLSQRIHPDKPYLGMMQGTRGKKIWSETVPSQLKWTAQRCETQDAIYNITLSIFIYPWDWIQELIAKEPDKSSDWTWYTFQEVIFMNLIPILQKNQDFIFQEIVKYFNYCEIESLDEQEENDILPLTEKEFNNFKKKTEKVTTKEIIAIEKYKKGVILEINRLRGRLTRVNKYLN